MPSPKDGGLLSDHKVTLDSPLISFTAVQRLSLQAGSVLVIQMPRDATQQEYDLIHSAFLDALQSSGMDNHIVVIPDSCKLTIAGRVVGRVSPWDEVPQAQGEES